jgi:hypothetical protein
MTEDSSASDETMLLTGEQSCLRRHPGALLCAWRRCSVPNPARQSIHRTAYPASAYGLLRASLGLLIASSYQRI